MSLLLEHTWEWHSARASELFQMALVMLADESMPRTERAAEFDRLLKRMLHHQAALELSAEVGESLR